MNTCERCGGKGFIERDVAYSARYYSAVLQCCDIAAYTREIKRRLLGEVPPAEPLARKFTVIEGGKNVDDSGSRPS